MLDDVVALLVCPHCGSALERDDSELLCERGHTFDVARQGYVSLLPGSAGKFTGDSAEMVADRANFLGAGHYDAIADLITREAETNASTILDAGCGTGHYLSALLDAAPAAVGVGLDVSKFAARRAARSHPRAGVVVADVWDSVPVRTGCIDVVTSIFSPRNAAELHRVLVPGGRLVVVTPTDRHLGQLVDSLGLVGVDARKPQRLGDTLSGFFDRITRIPLTYEMSLTRAEVASLVGMGPSARHADDRRADAIAALVEPVDVTASVVVGVYCAADS